MQFQYEVLSTKKLKPTEIIATFKEKILNFNKESCLGIEVFPSKNGTSLIYGIAIVSEEFGIFFDLESYAFNKLSYGDYYKELLNYIISIKERLYSFEYKRSTSLLYQMFGYFIPFQSAQALAVIYGHKGNLNETFAAACKGHNLPEASTEVINAYKTYCLCKHFTEGVSGEAEAIYLANQQLNAVLSMSPIKTNLQALQAVYKEKATIAFNGALFLNYLSLTLSECEEIKANPKLINLVGKYGFKKCLAESSDLVPEFGDFLRKNKEIFEEVISIYRDELQFIISISDARWKTQKAKPKVISNVALMLDKEWELSSLKKNCFMTQEELNHALGNKALKGIVPLNRGWNSPPDKNLENYANLTPETYMQLCKSLTTIAKELCDAGFIKKTWPRNWNEELPWFLKEEIDNILPLPQVVLPEYISDTEKLQLLRFAFDAILKLKDAHSSLRTYKQICKNLHKGSNTENKALNNLKEEQGDLFQTEYNVNASITNRWSSSAHNMFASESDWKRSFIPLRGTQLSQTAERYSKIRDFLKINNLCFREDDIIKLQDGWCIAKEYLPDYKIDACYLDKDALKNHVLFQTAAEPSIEEVM